MFISLILILTILILSYFIILNNYDIIIRIVQRKAQFPRWQHRLPAIPRHAPLRARSKTSVLFASRLQADNISLFPHRLTFGPCNMQIPISVTIGQLFSQHLCLRNDAISVCVTTLNVVSVQLTISCLCNVLLCLCDDAQLCSVLQISPSQAPRHHYWLGLPIPPGSSPPSRSRELNK